MDAGPIDGYCAEEFRSSEVSRILADALKALRNAKDELARLQAVRNGAEELTRLGDDGSDPIGDLSDIAIDNYGLSSELVQSAISKGIELGMEPKSLPSPPEGVSADDFYAYMPTHQYIFAPARDMWPGSSVNARLPKKEVTENGEVKQVNASAWLDRNRPVEQMTWAPGMPMVINNRLISLGGWIERDGVNVFNLYRPPTIRLGDPTKASPWIKHLQRIYPDDAKHISMWLAHRVQRPAEKINHAIVLGGPQGIGKDTVLEPVKYAVGPWNFAEVAPPQLLGRFNGYLKSVILRVSEAKDLGEVDRFTFYERMKTVTAAPPDVLQVDEKNLREYYVPNVTAPIITSNHRGKYPRQSRGLYSWSRPRRQGVADAAPEGSSHLKVAGQRQRLS
jgi:hypothetical protein